MCQLLFYCACVFNTHVFDHCQYELCIQSSCKNPCSTYVIQGDNVLLLVLLLWISRRLLRLFFCHSRSRFLVSLIFLYPPSSFNFLCFSFFNRFAMLYLDLSKHVHFFLIRHRNKLLPPLASYKCQHNIWYV